MKPLILLTGGTGAAANGTPTWALNQNYAENIRRAGGIPILAVNNDCAEEYADLADGHPEQCPVRRIFKTPSAYSTICTSPSWDRSAGRTFSSSTCSILFIMLIPPDLPSKDRGLFHCCESGTETFLPDHLF